jgi:hypothetical protein
MLAPQQTLQQIALTTVVPPSTSLVFTKLLCHGLEEIFRNDRRYRHRNPLICGHIIGRVGTAGLLARPARRAEPPTHGAHSRLAEGGPAGVPPHCPLSASDRRMIGTICSYAPARQSRTIRLAWNLTRTSRILPLLPACITAASSTLTPHQPAGGCLATAERPETQTHSRAEGTHAESRRRILPGVLQHCWRRRYSLWGTSAISSKRNRIKTGTAPAPL